MGVHLLGMKPRGFKTLLYWVAAGFLLWVAVDGFAQDGVYAPSAEPERRSADLHAYGIDNPNCWIEDGQKRCTGAYVTKSKIGAGAIYVPERHVPKNAMREYEKGLQALKNNDVKSAQQHLQLAADLYPKFSSAFNALGLALEMDPDTQNPAVSSAPERAFRQALSLNPNNADALANLGHLLVRQDKPLEAERLLRLATSLRPGSTKILAELMLAQAAQQHYDDVLATAKHIGPGQERSVPIVCFLRALAWENKSERAQAISAYREFLELSPNAHEAPLAQAALQRLNE